MIHFEESANADFFELIFLDDQALSGPKTESNQIYF